jgi:8-oxo-dGTP pyrophosphatase MutT (NUDIX family)
METMGIFSHDIYENIRTRTIVLLDGCILLHPPEKDGGIWGSGAWGLPGGGLKPHESLAECARREVLEETGILVSVGPIAFLQEWVVPRYAQALEPGAGHGYGLEVFHYASPEQPVPLPRPERAGDPPARWVPISEVPNLPIWPKQLKDLCQRLAEGRPPVDCTSFVGHLESPYARTQQAPFER